MKISQLQASDPIKYGTDKFSCHSYNDFYDELFDGKRSAPLDILEVGVHQGGSVRLWQDYLTEAKIYGVDIKPIDAIMSDGCSNRVTLVSHDMYDDRGMSNVTYTFLNGFKGFDVVVDDGSHILRDQIYALKWFPQMLKPGGILVIEDVPEGAEAEIIKYAPSGGTCEVINLRSVKNRWDDCLIVFKKDE